MYCHDVYDVTSLDTAAKWFTVAVSDVCSYGLGEDSHSVSIISSEAFTVGGTDVFHGDIHFQHQKWRSSSKKSYNLKNQSVGYLHNKSQVKKMYMLQNEYRVTGHRSSCSFVSIHLAPFCKYENNRRWKRHNTSAHEWREVTIYRVRITVSHVKSLVSRPVRDQAILIHGKLCFKHTNPMKTEIAGWCCSFFQGWYFLTRCCVRYWYCDLISADIRIHTYIRAKVTSTCECHLWISISHRRIHAVAWKNVMINAWFYKSLQIDM